VNRIVADNLIPFGEMTMLRFSSENPENRKFAVNAIDGDPNTTWHTAWSSGLAEPPHELVIDLGAQHQVTGFRYLARQDSGWNGTFGETEFFLAEAPDTFDDAPDLKTTFSQVKSAQVADLTQPRAARYLKVRILSEVGKNPWASAAEIGVIGTR